MQLGKYHTLKAEIYITKVYKTLNRLLYMFQTYFKSLVKSRGLEISWKQVGSKEHELYYKVGSEGKQGKKGSVGSTKAFTLW